MSRHARKFGCTLAALALCLGVPGLAGAYSQLTDWSGGKGTVAYFHWDDADLPVVYYVDPGGSGIPGLDGRALVDRCFAPWNDVPTSHFSAVNGGDAPDYDGDNNITIADIDWKVTSAPPLEIPLRNPAIYPSYPAGSFRNDGRVEVIFDDTGEFFDRMFGPDSGVLGLDFPVVNPSTGRILDSDIIVSVPAVKDHPELDLEAILVHEIGHLAGLGHSGLFRSVPQDKLPTLYPYADLDNPTAPRTLEPDDEVSLSIIYPTSDFQTRFGRIRGKVTQFHGNLSQSDPLMDQGQPAFGAQVGVIDESTGFSVTTIAGYYDNPHSGRYELPGLPAGSYKVFVEPIDGSEEAGNVSGLNISALLLHTFGWSFPREFFNNVADQSDAAVVTVQAGKTVSGVDFILGTENGGAPLSVHLRTRSSRHEGGSGGGCSIASPSGGKPGSTGLLVGILLGIPAILRVRRRRAP